MLNKLYFQVILAFALVAPAAAIPANPGFGAPAPYHEEKLPPQPF